MMGAIDSEQKGAFELWERRGSPPTWKSLVPDLAVRSALQIRAVDTGRGAIVVLETSFNRRDDLFELGPAGLERKQRDVSAFALAQDDHRHETVLVQESGAQIWDGSALRTPAPSTPAPAFACDVSAAYDPGSERVVVYGGGTSGRETWTWDGARWEQVASDGGPTPNPRYRAALVSVPKLHGLLLTGGCESTYHYCHNDPCAPLDDVWLWKDAAWTQLPLAKNAPLDLDFALALNPVRQELLSVVGKSPAPYRVYGFDGEGWTSIPGAPPTNGLGVLAYDRARRRMVNLRFGGDPEPILEFHLRGGSCAVDAECDTGHCVDGTCCESAACGTCASCNQMGSPGVCAPVLGAPDPDSCPTAGGRCDLEGACKAGLGAPCSDGATDCVSGVCADGVCCETSCSGVCETCNERGSEGRCVPVRGIPDAGHGSCPAAPEGFACQAPVCDGIVHSRCVGYPGAETACGPPSCAGEEETPAARCDGRGACVASTARTCAPFACGAERCNASCARDEDCARGFRCAESGACVAREVGCDTATGDRIRADGTAEPCDGHYRCRASGECAVRCASSDDCAPGFVCDAKGACIDAARVSVSASGCTMAARAPSSGALGWAFAACAGLLGRRARRRGASIALTLLGLGVAIACTARPGEHVGSTEARLEPDASADASAGAPLAEVLVWDRLFQPMPESARLSAYDEARGRLMTFATGGQRSDNAGKVFTSATAFWEWDGAWADRTPSPVPIADGTLLESLTWDRARGIAWLFASGQTSGAGLWTWNGSALTHVTSVHRPHDLHLATLGLVPIPAPGRLLVLGRTLNTDVLAHTLEWDGVDWTERAPHEAPPYRDQPAFAFDEVSGKGVLLGGCIPRGLLGCTTVRDAWTWSEGEWEPLDVDPLPPALAAAAFDRRRQRIVACDGYVNQPAEAVRAIAQCYALQGRVWERLTDDAPGPSGVRRLFEDPIGQRLLALDDEAGLRVWALEGTPARWKLLNDHESPGDSYSMSALVFDRARDRSVLVGQSTSAALDGDLWELHGQRFTVRHAGLSGAPTTAAYDAERGETVIVAPSGVTFAWNGDAVRRIRPAAGSPSPTFMAGLEPAVGYDDVRKVVVLFGAGDALNETWEWNGALWTRRVGMPGAAPPARYGSHLVYAADRGGMILVGGCACTTTAGDCRRSAAACRPLSDTWRWDGDAWQIVATTGAYPGGGRLIGNGSTAAYDPIRHRALFFDAVHDSLSFLDGQAWRPADLDPRVAEIDRASLTFDPVRRRALLFGRGEVWSLHARGGTCASDGECHTGHCVDGACCETASCGTCASCNQPGSPGVCAPLREVEDPDTCPAARGKRCNAGSQCTSQLAATCEDDGECLSGHCVDHVCCNMACGGVCEACDVTDNVGHCIAVTEPRPGHGTCPDPAPGNEACGRASCDGVGRNECAGRPGTETRCASPSCADGAARAAGFCDGRGSCQQPRGVACAPYRCGAEACLARCASDHDCAPDATCDVPFGACLGKYRCDAVTGERVAPDGARLACENHLRCSPDGACPARCISRDECASGYVCDLRGSCIEITQDLGGIRAGCTLAPARSNGPFGASLGGLVVLAWRRRARSRCFSSRRTSATPGRRARSWGW
jgi:hypothetical protein